MSDEILIISKSYITCPSCFKVLASFFRHDYRTCGCDANCMIDGGQDYLRYGIDTGPGWPMPEIEKGNFIYNPKTGEYILVEER